MRKGLLKPKYRSTDRRLIEEMRSRTAVANALLSARLALGLSQADLAFRAVTKQSRISEIEGMTGNPRFETLDRVSRVVGLMITLVPREPQLHPRNATGWEQPARAVPFPIWSTMAPLNLIGVAVVVDPDFGDRLAVLAKRMSVWIADTPANLRSVERVIAVHADADLTTFKVDPSRTREQWCAKELDMIDLHHGQYSRTPPYSLLEIHGAEPTHELCGALAARGFERVVRIEGGFHVTRPDVGPAA
jgi:transcriptional regulator with XRE-family HTH domain